MPASQREGSLVGIFEFITMKIPHLTATDRSAFYSIVMSALKNGAPPIQIDVGKAGGYPGRHTVTIGAVDELEFEADVELSDWTRFSARIRAACTALRDSNMPGNYLIAHEDGQLSVQPSPGH